MTLIFYLLLVWLSDSAMFSWWWFFVALLFSANDTRTIYSRQTVYKYTNDPTLDGEDFEE